MEPLAHDDRLGRRQSAAAAAFGAAAVLCAVPEVWLPGVGAAAAALAILAAALGVSLPTRMLERILLAWVGWAVLSLAWSVDRGQTAFTAVLWCGAGALVVGSGPASAAVLRKAAAVAVLACALQALNQLVVGFDAAHLALDEPDAQLRDIAVQWLERRRVFAPFNSPDSLAGFLLAVTPVAATLVFSDDQHDRVLGGLASVMGLVTLTLTWSAGGVLCLAAGVAACAAARLWVAGRRRDVALALGGAAGLSALVWLVRATGDPASASASAHERLGDWLNAMRLAIEAPWYGVGAGAFESAFNAWSPQGRRYAAYAHSGLLQVTVELGVPGLLLALATYAGGVVWAVRRAVRGGAWEALAAAGVVGGILHHQLDYDLHVGAGLGLAIAAGVLRAGGAHASEPEEAHAGLRAGAFLAAAAAAYLATGAALVERGVPRLPGDEPHVDTAESGAAMLRFDAHAQIALAEDYARLAQGVPEGAAQGLWQGYEAAAARVAVLAPMLPAGPMMLARLKVAQRDIGGALQAYEAAMARACCSRRLHEERKGLAELVGREDLVEVDRAWLEQAR